MADNEIRVDSGYRPRPLQDVLHRVDARFRVLNCHRRFGKSVWAVNEVVEAAKKCDKKNPYYAYIAQNYQSAKRIIWQYVKDYTAQIPNVKTNESELLITIPRPWRGDKIRIQLLGSERPDSLRGLYFDGIVFDEFAFSDPTAWEKIVRPALADRKGWAVLISTPNGRNHFFDVYQYAERQWAAGNKNWFAATVRASESGVLDAEELDDIRSQVGEEAYQQEFECSFYAQIKGAYYKDHIAKARKEKRIGIVRHDSALPVYVSFDLGIGDSTSLWFAQRLRDEVHLIDFYEDSGKGLDFYVRLLKEKGYIYEQIILPHDANARELGTGRTRVETLRTLGLQDLKIMPRQTIADGISAARFMLDKCWFDEEKCRRGLECLESYHKQYNEKMHVYVDQPVHDWSSHAADSFRYLALGIEDPGGSKRRNIQLSKYRHTDSSYDILNY